MNCIFSLRTTPLFIAPALVGFAFYTLKSQSTYMYNTDFVATADLDVDKNNMKFFVKCMGDLNCTVRFLLFTLKLECLCLFYQLL